MIFSLIAASFLLYWVLYRNTDSVFIRPTLQKLVFFREYLFLTMMPYLYYLSDNRYQKHYIFGVLDSSEYFYTAAIFAFIFIVFFLLTYYIFEPVFRASLRSINPQVSYGKLLFYLKSITLIMTVYFAAVSFKYNAGVFGLFKFSTIELEIMRAYLGGSGGFLLFNKIVIKSWIPMLSYVYFYLFFSKVVRFRIGDKFVLAVSALLGLLASVWFFEKSVVVFYLFGIVGVYVFSGGSLSKKFTVFMPLVFISFVGFMYIIIYQDKIVDSQYLLDILLHRAMSQSTGSVMAVHYFADHDFLYFSGISNFLASLSGDTFQSPYGVIIDYYVPASADTSGAMSSFVTGEAYGLFGFFGVLISGVIIGLYYSFFEAVKVSSFLSIVFIGIYGLYFSHFYISSSFYSFLWPVGLVYQIVPFLLIAILVTRFKKVRP